MTRSHTQNVFVMHHKETNFTFSCIQTQINSQFRILVEPLFFLSHVFFWNPYPQPLPFLHLEELCGQQTGILSKPLDPFQTRHFERDGIKCDLQPPRLKAKSNTKNYQIVSFNIIYCQQTPKRFIKMMRLKFEPFEPDAGHEERYQGCEPFAFNAFAYQSPES